MLGDLLYDARHIVVVADADGCLLWSEGHPTVLRASERIRFSPGHAWSEQAAGTNAVGTALAADHAVQVFSAEHYRSEVHGWQCSGTPVHDPETGHKLGAIDVTGTYDTAHPRRARRPPRRPGGRAEPVRPGADRPTFGDRRAAGAQSGRA